MPPVFLAVLVCSDGDCDAVVEALGDLDELDVLVCESCDCTLELVQLAGAELARLPGLRAERVGFEPTRQVVPAHAISSRAP